jgi:hypothetical protein
MHDINAMREMDEFLQVRRDQQNGRAFPAEQGELFVEVHSGADVDARGRFAEYVNLARPAERTRENQLLLVTAGEFLGELRLQPRPDIEHRRDLFDKVGEASLSQEPAPSAFVRANKLERHVLGGAAI